ncbi:lipopolysaccharide heptosyltransferase I [soil metagenome]
MIEATLAATKPARRILIVRLSALGDVIMASGLVPALRAIYPQAHLAWLTESPAAPLLAHNPRLDEVIVWPRAQWLKLWRERRFMELGGEMRRFRRELRDRHFDLALDTQGLLKSAVWSWLSAAPRRVGLIPREGGQWLATERLVPAREADALIGREYRALARYLGAPEGAFRLDLAVGDAARNNAATKLRARGVGASQGYVVLCPFTTRPQKHWFEDRWAALADRLSAAGFTPVLLGGPSDAEAAARITAASPRIVDLTGRLALDESIAAVAGSRLLIGVDTGLTHAGTALLVPTIALFGSTRPYGRTDSPRTTVLYEKLFCSPCRRNPTCGGVYQCMRAHTVEAVITEALRLMALPDSGLPPVRVP